jgi:hypothetical protein
MAKLTREIKCNHWTVDCRGVVKLLGTVIIDSQAMIQTASRISVVKQALELREEWQRRQDAETSFVANIEVPKDCSIERKEGGFELRSSLPPAQFLISLDSNFNLARRAAADTGDKIAAFVEGNEKEPEPEVKP